MDPVDTRVRSRLWREALLREAEIWSDDARFVAARDSVPPVERFYELRGVVRPDVKDRARLVPSEVLSAIDAGIPPLGCRAPSRLRREADHTARVA